MSFINILNFHENYQITTKCFDRHGLAAGGGGGAISAVMTLSEAKTFKMVIGKGGAGAWARGDNLSYKKTGTATASNGGYSDLSSIDGTIRFFARGGGGSKASGGDDLVTCGGDGGVAATRDTNGALVNKKSGTGATGQYWTDHSGDDICQTVTGAKNGLGYGKSVGKGSAGLCWIVSNNVVSNGDTYTSYTTTSSYNIRYGSNGYIRIYRRGTNKFSVFFYSDDELVKFQRVTKGGDAEAPTVTKEGYDFQGWDGDYTNVQSDLTINAIWNPKVFSVVFETNGGKTVDTEFLVDEQGNILKDAEENELVALVEVPSEQTYTYGTGLVLPKCTKDSYVFEGWFDNAELTGTAISLIGTTEQGNKTFWAKFSQ